MSGSGISCAIWKFAPRSRQITTPAPHYSVFTGRLPFLPPNQQRQSTEGNNESTHILHNFWTSTHRWEASPPRASWRCRWKLITHSLTAFVAAVSAAGSVVVPDAEHSSSAIEHFLKLGRHLHDLWVYIERQWRNFVPYRCQLVFAAILWVKLWEIFNVT